VRDSFGEEGTDSYCILQVPNYSRSISSSILRAWEGQDRRSTEWLQGRISHDSECPQERILIDLVPRRRRGVMGLVADEWGQQLSDPKQ
jgi:hypothetical protein